MRIRSGLLALGLGLLTACGGGDSLGPGDGQILVEPSTITLAQQESQQLQVSVVDEAGTLITGVAVRFASSDTTRVTVSATGLVRSVGPAGPATVTVSAGDLEKEVPVTVSATSTRIEVAPNPGVLPQKGTLQLEASVIDAVGTPVAGAQITYSVAPGSIVSVSPTGLVTSNGPAGQATVQVKSGELVTQAVLAVVQVPTLLRIQPDPVRLAVGGQLQLQVQVLDAVDQPMAQPPLTYSASPAGLLSVSATGLLRSVGGTGSGTLVVESGEIRREVAVEVVTAAHPNGTVVASPELSGSPYGAAIASNGRVVVASLYGGVSSGSVASFTFSSQSAPGMPNAVAIDADGTRAWVSNTPESGVTEFDVSGAAPVALGTVTGLVGTAFDAVLSRDGKELYVSTGAGMVYFVDVATRTVVHHLEVGGGIVHLALHPTQAKLYTSAPDYQEVREIDLGTRTHRRISVTGRPQALAVSHDGSTLYVANESGSASFVSIATGTQNDLALGCGGYGLGLTPDGTQVYVSCALYGQVVIVDPSARAVRKTLTVGGTPRRVTVSPDGMTVAIPNEAGWVDFIQ